MPKILIIDDEKSIRNTLKEILAYEGYDVTEAQDGAEGVRLAEKDKFDIILSDIKMPKIDGLEVCRRIQATRRVPVLMLTARDDETDILVGLGVGADDYMTKPFSPRELVARVKAALRRVGGVVTARTELVFKRLRVDVDARLAWKDEQPLDLTPIEFDLLHVLVRNSGRTLNREQLIEQVWGYDYYGDDRVVDVHIGRLRKKIEDDPADPTLIATVWGAGYRFEDEPA